MSKDTRILVLAGAGLVQEAGLPTSVQLAVKLKEALLEAAENRGQGVAEQGNAQACLAALRFLIGGIRFQRGILNRDPDEEIGVLPNFPPFISRDRGCFRPPGAVVFPVL